MTTKLSNQITALDNVKQTLKNNVVARGVPYENVNGATFQGLADAVLQIEGPTVQTPAIWERPIDWLSIPAFDVTKDEIFLLVAVFERENNPIGIYITSSSSFPDFTYECSDGQTGVMSQGQNITLNFPWDTTPADTLCARGYRQVLIKISGARDALKMLKFLNPAWDGMSYNTGIPTGRAVSLLELKANVNQIDEMHFATSANSYMQAQLRMLESIDIEGRYNYTNLSYLFSYLNSLKNVKLYAPYGNTYSYMFKYCYSIEAVEMDAFNNIGQAREMFSECRALKRVKFRGVGLKTTYLYSTFYFAPSLVIIEGVDAGSSTNNYLTFRDCYSLSRFIPPEGGYSFGGNTDLSNCSFTRTALIEVFNSLKPVTVATTLTITNNIGTVYLTNADRQIAIDKGWTITG